ncbi:MAG TPA: hypothetical protein VHN11_19405 [Xanthobacteraceae bacterium]|jgi:hypothetical protein|nr:hypothetical protein [Xanthobacteraceae bacterium]
MNWTSRTFTRIAAAVSMCVVAALALAQSSESQNVATQRIASPGASLKIGAVFWTRRTDHYTLQVVFPRSTAICARPNTTVMVWLLGADGATIPVSRTAASSCSEDTYSVSLSDGPSAVAVALKVDDEYYIEGLKKLE